MSRGYYHFTAPIGLGLLAGLIAAAVPTFLSTLNNAYLSHGFYRTVVYDLSSGLERYLLPALASVFAITIVTAIWSKIFGFRGKFFSFTMGLAAGLAVFLTQGYIQNRYKLPVRWRDKRELFGIELPEPLFQWQVWKTNILITLGAIAVALAVWLILRRMLREPQSCGYRFWRAMGSPISVLVMLILVVATPLLANTLRHRATGRPNIVLVSLDALRVDHLGCYGYHRDTSPEMDRLAENGIVFDWAICQAPTTLPSHMSTLTSLYPTVHSIRMGRRLPGWRLTLAEYLREHGYRTAACTAGGFMSMSYGFGQGFEIQNDEYKSSNRSVPMMLHWLDNELSDRPFFLLFHTYDIHSPYNPPEPWKEMFTDPSYRGGFEPSSRELERIRKQVESDPERGHGLSQEDIDFIVGRYDAGIRWVDHWIGKLVGGLEERGLLESTWIVLTADHGEEFTEHGAFLHGKLYLTCAHVPLIIRPPTGAPKVRAVPEIVELLDLMPTFLDLAGVSPADTLQGRSLLPLMWGKETEWDNLGFSEHHSKGGRRSVVSPTLHILTSLEYGELEAYDYLVDPLEQSPLDDPARDDEIRDLFQILQSWSQEQIVLGEKQRGTEDAEIDLQTIEQLRALGYIE